MITASHAILVTLRQSVDEHFVNYVIIVIKTIFIFSISISFNARFNAWVFCETVYSVRLMLRCT